MAEESDGIPDIDESSESDGGSGTAGTDGVDPVPKEAPMQQERRDSEVNPIILQFMARSTMKSMLVGDPNAFGRHSISKSPEEKARELFERSQKDKRDYMKKLKRDVIYLALGKGTDEWKFACFRAFRRCVKEPWLAESAEYPGSPSPTELEAEAMRLAKLEARKSLEGSNTEATKRGTLNKRRSAGNGILAALEAQMAAERASMAAEGTREAELQAELLKLYESQKGDDKNLGKNLAKLRKSLKDARRQAEKEAAEEKRVSQYAYKPSENTLQNKEKTREMMLRAKGIFEEGGMADVKLWLESRQRKNRPTLDSSFVEANPEPRANLNELPLARTLGQPAVVWRRPKSSFSKFYASTNAGKPQTTLHHIDK